MLDPPDDLFVARVGDDGAEADPEVEHASQLLLFDVTGQPVEDGRTLPRVPVDVRAQPVGDDAREIGRDSASRYVRERVCPIAQPADVVQVEPRRREQIVAVVVVELQDLPDQREAVRVDARRCEPDDAVAGGDVRAVDEAIALDEADAGPGEVELVVAIDPGELGSLAADQGATGRAANLGGAVDKLRNLLEVDAVRREVVEEEQRICAGRDDVVDAVSGQIGAAVAQRAALASDDQLRPDRVGRRGEQPPSSMGWSPAKAPKPVAPVDSTAARRRSTRASAVASETPAASYVFAPSATPASLNEQFGVKLGPADGAAGDEADDRFAHVEGRFTVVQIEQLGQRFCLPLRVVGPELELGDRERLRVPEQLLEPVARRMELHAVAGAGRDERPPAAVLLHPQLELVGACERRGEVVLVERDPYVVDARDVPLAGWTTTLTAPRSSSVRRSLKPSRSSSCQATPGS